jgi:hypothetical protein
LVFTEFYKVRVCREEDPPANPEHENDEGGCGLVLRGDRIAKRSGAGVENMVDSIVGVVDVRVRNSENNRSGGECIVCAFGSIGVGKRRC